MPFGDLSELELPPQEIIALEGIGGTGKSKFILDAQAPVAYQRIGDAASDGVLRKAQRERADAVIRVANYGFERPRSEKSGYRAEKFDDDVIAKAKSTLDSIIADYRQALQEGYRTIGWDKFFLIWELVRVAEFGKVEQVPEGQYAAVNWKMRSWVNEAKNFGANLILVNEMGEEWKDSMIDGKRQSSRTGRWKRVGWKGTQNVATLILRMFRKGDETDPTGTKPDEEGYGHFCCRVDKCNENGSLVHTVIDFNEYAEMLGVTNTYAVVMSQVYGNDPSDWM